MLLTYFVFLISKSQFVIFILSTESQTSSFLVQFAPKDFIQKTGFLKHQELCWLETRFCNSNLHSVVIDLILSRCIVTVLCVSSGFSARNKARSVQNRCLTNPSLCLCYTRLVICQPLTFSLSNFCVCGTSNWLIFICQIKTFFFFEFFSCHTIM